MTTADGKQIDLSVIVVSFSDAATLSHCLDALYQEKSGAAVEVIVVRDAERMHSDVQSVLQQMKEKHPHLSVLEAQRGTTVPNMRKEGLKAAGGEIIALIEDDCVVSLDWCSAQLAAHRGQCAGAGGPVVPDQFRKPLDWGYFFCEYARFMPPFEGDVSALPGNNMSYKRAALNKLIESGQIDNGFYEVFINSSLLAAGEHLHADPALAVRNTHSWSRAAAFSVPFHHGRGYAGMRFSGAPLKRILYLFLSFALPALQTLRLCRTVIARKGYALQLYSAIPAIVIFYTSWSAGEFMGYLLGPGTSLERWR
ncbi:MAG: glycosyltransferase family 2 protein [Terriglobales bacterium]